MEVVLDMIVMSVFWCVGCDVSFLVGFLLFDFCFVLVHCVGLVEV